MKRRLPTPREYVARQYEAVGQRELAAKVRRGLSINAKVLFTIRAVEAAQRDAIAHKIGG